MNQEDTNNAKEILSTIRGVAKDYIEGRILFSVFYKQLSDLLGMLDPIDEALVALGPARQQELEFYLKYSGGEFGETDNLLPRNKEWRQGDSQKPYSWVDEDKFFEMFSSEYRKLNA